MFRPFIPTYNLMTLPPQATAPPRRAMLPIRQTFPITQGLRSSTLRSLRTSTSPRCCLCLSELLWLDMDPENLSSPIERNASFAVNMLDSCVASTSPPNRVRDFTSDPPHNPTFGFC